MIKTIYLDSRPQRPVLERAASVNYGEMFPKLTQIKGFISKRVFMEKSQSEIRATATRREGKGGGVGESKVDK